MTGSSATASTLQTFTKGLQILEVLEQSNGKGLTAAELARQLHLPKTSVHRLLVTLQQRGYVERDEDGGRYALGLRILTLASALLSDLDLRRVGLPYLTELGRRVGETVHLVVLDQERREVVTVERIEGHSPLSLRTQIGSRRPMYCTAVGKAMLAFLEQEVFRQVVTDGLAAITAQTITDPRRLEVELQEVRTRGYALDDEEFTVGVRCVAAPIFDHRCGVAGAVSIAAPAFRTPMPQIVGLSGPVMETARGISERLGYRPAMTWIGARS